jgi:hypothetical protein
MLDNLGKRIMRIDHVSHENYSSIQDNVSTTADLFRIGSWGWG